MSTKGRPAYYNHETAAVYSIDDCGVDGGLGQTQALIRRCRALLYSEVAVMKCRAGVVVLYIAACLGQLFNHSL